MGESAPADEQHFPFTRLPPDIQYSVCQSLCAHCRHDGDTMEILYHEPGEQTEALRNLCLVSRNLQSFAQPILYHFPRIYFYTDFFRTFKSRPHLATHVKVHRCVYVDKMGRYPVPGERHRENIWYLRSLAVALGLDDTDPAKFGETYYYYPNGDEEDVDGTGFSELCMAFGSLITSIIMGLCARLEIVTIDLRDADAELRCLNEWPTKYKYLPGLAKQRPEGLPSIHTLVLRNTMHLDPNTLGIDHVSFLGSLLPNVKRLIFFKGEKELYVEYLKHLLASREEPRPEYSWKAFAHLRELRFLRYSRYSAKLPLPAIQSLVVECKALETFVFSPVDTAFSPAQLLQSISSAASTLRHLTINCPIPNAPSVDAEYLIGSELKLFINLDILILDQAVFCHHHHHHHHHHDAESTIAPECLTNLLPTSVRQLTVNIHARFEPIVDLIALGEAASGGEFPRLKYLRVQMTFEDQHWPEAEPPATPPRFKYHLATYAPITGRPAEVNRPLLEPRMARKKLLTDAFAGTSVRLVVDFYRRRLHAGSNDWKLSWPIAGSTADARLIDVEE